MPVYTNQKLTFANVLRLGNKIMHRKCESLPHTFLRIQTKDYENSFNFPYIIDE